MSCTLGPSGPQLSPLCLGTMTWGRQTSLEDAHRQIDMALEHGVNFLDTAEMYPVNPIMAETRGDTEAVIGAWNSKGARDRLVIATKITGEGSAVIEGGAPMITGERLRASVEGSLSRLKTDRIDLFQLHWPNRGSYHFRSNWTYRPPFGAAQVRAHMTDVLSEAQRLMDEGKIGALGVSNETAWGLSQWAYLARVAGLPKVAAVQNEYSLLCRLFDTDMAEACVMEDVPLLAFSPLATGLLTGKYAGDVVPDGSRRERNPDLGGRITPRVWEAVSAYLALARQHGLDPAQMAVAWHFTRPFRSIPIIGATSSEQLAHLLPAKDMVLGDELCTQIDQIHQAHPMPF